jgi:hypothetical protein
MKTSASRLFYILYLTGITALILFSFNSYKALKFHEIYTTYERWPEGSRRYNEKTGFEMTSSFSGVIEHPQTFELKTHRWGYRIPGNESSETHIKGGILFTGCSFTFGDEINAENSFPQLTGEMLKMPVYNYGVCDYSYASVLRELQDLSSKGILDSLQPNYLVLGAGDWLIERSLSPFYPTSHLQLAYPHISKKNNALEITDPPFFYSIKHLYGMKEKYGQEANDRSLNFSRFLVMSDLVPRVTWANFRNKTWKPDSI